MKKILGIIFIYAFVFNTSCISYYAKYESFNENFEQGKLEQADAVLAKDKKGPTNNSRLLYYMNRGVVNSYLGNYELSNQFLEEAYNISEIQSKSMAEIGSTYLLNPKVSVYRGETFEVLLVNYYKALNYLKMGDYENALVECKRMDIRLNKLSDKFSAEAKYKRDAFIHLLMGLIYDINYDYNNAFIAYRNAYEIYTNDYIPKFGTAVPNQLKYDLLRTAYLNGFMDDVRRYEEIFETKYQHVNTSNKAQVLFLWNNGLSPVKQEWSIDFVIVEGSNGLLTFVNLEMGIVVPVYVGSGSQESASIKDLQIIRMALPKYVERPKVSTSAQVRYQNTTIPFELVEDVNAIAFKALNDRFLTELGQALTRLALKKVAEMELRKQDETAGALLGVFNAVSEQADTRNWQTLPHEIQYAKVYVDEGDQLLNVDIMGNSGQSQTLNFNINAKAKSTVIQTINGF
jgi:hypothetical protein